MRILCSCFVAVLAVSAACGSAKPAASPANVARPPADRPMPPAPIDGLRVEWIPSARGRTAGIEGTLRYATNEPVPGVTIVVTAPSIHGGLTAITDENGQFVVTDLQPDTYEVSFYYGEDTRRADVRVDAGKMTRITLEWKLDGAPDIVGAPAAAPSTFTSALDALTHGAVDAAAASAQAELEQRPSARTHAVFALALYGRAINAFQQDLATTRHGPNVRQLRSGLYAFALAIDDVQDQLVEAAKDPQFSLELCVACITADGALGLPPGLLDVERDRAGKLLPEGDARRRPTIRFDAGDIAWARAMLSFQQALANIALAYDWSWAEPLLTRDPKDGDRITIAVVEPARIARARALVLAGLKLSDDARTAYLAETDDDREWVPSPRQTSYGSPLAVDATLYATWAAVVGDVRALVDGKTGISLPAVWNLLELGKGAPRGFIDVGAMFTSPTPIVIEVGAIDRIEREKNAKAVSKLTERFIKDLIGNGYRPKMPASKLTDRLLSLRAELAKSGDDALADKLKYVMWLN